MVTCSERTHLLALDCDVLLSRCRFPIGILGQVWCLIISIPDICPFSYLEAVQIGHSRSRNILQRRGSRSNVLILFSHQLSLQRRMVVCTSFSKKTYSQYRVNTVGQCWHDTKCCLGSFVIFQGYIPVFPRKPTAL